MQKARSADSVTAEWASEVFLNISYAIYFSFLILPNIHVHIIEANKLRQVDSKNNRAKEGGEHKVWRVDFVNLGQSVLPG